MKYRAIAFIYSIGLGLAGYLCWKYLEFDVTRYGFLGLFGLLSFFCMIAVIFGEGQPPVDEKGNSDISELSDETKEKMYRESLKTINRILRKIVIERGDFMEVTKQIMFISDHAPKSYIKKNVATFIKASELFDENDKPMDSDNALFEFYSVVHVSMAVYELFAKHPFEQGLEFIAHGLRENKYVDLHWPVIVRHLIHNKKASSKVIELVGSKIPKEKAGIAYCYLINSQAMHDDIDSHPFDCAEGHQFLSKWLDGDELPFIAAMTLAFLPSNPETFALNQKADSHNDIQTQVFALWSRVIRDNDYRAAKKLIENSISDDEDLRDKSYAVLFTPLMIRKMTIFENSDNPELRDISAKILSFINEETDVDINASFDEYFSQKNIKNSFEENNKSFDKIQKFSDSDEEMESAFNKATLTFKYFLRELSWENRRIIPSLNMATAKVRFYNKEDDGPHIEHMWVSDISFDGHKINGTLNSMPNWIPNLQPGDEVSVNLEDISDWMFYSMGDVYGGFSIKLIRSRMSSAERKAHDNAWGVDFGDGSTINLAYTENDKISIDLFDTEMRIAQSEHPMSVNMKETYEEQLSSSNEIIEFIDSNGNTMLHLEAMFGNKLTVETLLKYGANKGLKNNYGQTALDLAKLMDWPEIIRLLENKAELK